MVRRGVFGLLLLCVPQIVGGGDAKDGAPRRGESVRDSAVKPVDGHPTRPIRTAGVSDRPGKAEELTRFRIVTSDGVLVIYDAAIPPGTNQSRDREGADRQNREREQPANSVNPGFVGYWNDFDTEQLYVFDQLLLTLGDVVVAVASLQRDFALDPDLFASDDLGVSRISSIPPATKEGARGQSSHEATEPRSHEGGGAGTIDDGSWEPASRESILTIMGFGAEEDGSGGVAGTIWDCWPVMVARAIEPLPRPPPGASPDDVIQLAVASAGCPPPGGCGCCTDRCCQGSSCCHSPDPCCNQSDPCCGNPNRCCNPDNPCCGSTDPCCNSSDPCCGNPNPCCNPDNPCCGNPDPCCGSSDPCCGSTDPCCGDPCCGVPCCGAPCCGEACCDSTDPCCGSTDPCCDNTSDCCGDSNRCCGNLENPCCHSDDPCCNENDPCCGSDDPCCNPDNQDCGVCEVACCRSSDPCCNNPDPCCDPNPLATAAPDPCCSSADKCCGVTCPDGPCTDCSCISEAGNPNAGKCSCRCTTVTIGSPLPPNLVRKKAIIVPANEDDDDDNHVMDSEQADPAADENDLTAVSLTCGTLGTLRLSCSGFCNRVRLWKNANRTDPLDLGKCWSSCEQGCEPIGNRPTIIYVEGIQASEGDGDIVLSATFVKRDAACVFECICTDTAPLTVVSLKEGSLTWEVADDTGNPDLGNCDNNGGKKIFPDLINPSDGANAAKRRTVDLVATIKPKVKGATVYFKVWDVDDPFNDNHQGMPNVSLIDSGWEGPDNRPVPEAPITKEGTTNERGEARVPFTVSMQPGNNYRAGASVISHARGQADQTKADDMSLEPGHGDFAGYKVPLTWSPMLTVWRKLHVEVDSMSGEPITVDGRKPDWDRVVVFGAAVNQAAGTTTLNVTSQTTTLGGVQSGETNHYEGGSLTVPTLPQPISILENTSNTLVADRILNDNEIAAIIGVAGTLKDDDPTTPGQLPYYPTLSPFVKHAYATAYIDIVVIPTEFNPRTIVAFDVNLTDIEVRTGVGFDNSQDVFSSAPFWAALLVIGYQGNESDDQDGDADLGDNSNPRGSNSSADQFVQVGTTVEDSDNASVIFIEVLRDAGQQEGKDLDHTIAHEIGHSAGNNTPEAQEHAELGIMTKGAPVDQNSFTAPTLKRFREAEPW